MASKTRLDIDGGGIFSKMMVGMQNVEKYDLTIENCYFNVVDVRALNEEGFNPFDHVLDQTLDQEYVKFRCTSLPAYNSKGYLGVSKVEESEQYLRLKAIASKLKYQEDLLKIVDSYAEQFDENTVGVHIRLCDMNTFHEEEYGTIRYEDYLRAIIEETPPGSTLFVASDNVLSIKKLRSSSRNRILWVDDMVRAATEKSDSYNLQLDHLKDQNFWREAFTDMLLLSKCSKLICRTSNLANMAIISSNTLKKIRTL